MSRSRQPPVPASSIPSRVPEIKEATPLYIRLRNNGTDRTGSDWSERLSFAKEEATTLNATPLSTLQETKGPFKRVIDALAKEKPPVTTIGEAIEWLAAKEKVRRYLEKSPSPDTIAKFFKGHLNIYSAGGGYIPLATAFFRHTNVKLPRAPAPENPGKRKKIHKPSRLTFLG